MNNKSVSALLAVVLTMVLVLPVSLITAEPVKATEMSLQLDVSMDKDTFAPGESIRVRIAISHGSSENVCVVYPEEDKRGVANPRSNLQVALVSSVGAIEPLQGGDQDFRASIMLLRPQQVRHLTFDLLELYGPLAADTYTLFVRYRASDSDNLRFRETFRAQECDLWAGPSVSNPVEIRVQPGDEQETVKRHISRWREGDPQQKWQALLWLKNNVLKPGMTENEVYDLLGSPMSRVNNESWTYRVGRVGIVITFTQGKVTQVSGFET